MNESKQWKGGGGLHQLYLTKQQRRLLLKWALYALLFLLTLLLQEVVLCRLPVFGARFHLLPGLIVCVCLAEGAEGGGVFALCATLFWALAGADLGFVSIAVLTFCGVGSALLLDHLLVNRLPTCCLCCLGALLLHDTVIFLLHLFLGSAALLQFVTVVLPGVVISTVPCPLFYTLTRKISRIGG